MSPPRYEHRPYSCRVWLGCCLAAVALAASGCRDTVSSRLVGRWEGHPDSASEFLARQSTGGQPQVDGAELAESRPPASPPFPDATQLQQYDVRIVLDFAGDHSVTMWRDDNQQNLVGNWKVLEANGGRATVEIATPPGGDGRPPARRRFELHWGAEGDGFTLQEEGADPQFGWLYFRRVAS